jgi:hypothetical protein
MFNNLVQHTLHYEKYILVVYIGFFSWLVIQNQRNKTEVQAIVKKTS